MSAYFIVSNKHEALVSASGKGDIGEMTRLIREEADVNHVLYVMHEGAMRGLSTPLTSASLGGREQAVTLLLDSGADAEKPEAFRGRTAMHHAAERGHVRVMDILRTKGARIDARDKEGCTPLGRAVSYGCKEATSYLLDHGADANAADECGWTPLMSAAQKKDLHVVDVLIRRGADPNLQTNRLAEEEGQTALHTSASDGFYDIVRRLLDGGADLNLVDKRRMSPLFFAAQEGHLKIVRLLVNKGANIRLSSDIGLAPVHIAALCGKNEVVEYLIEKGATFETVGTLAKACKCCGAPDATLKCALCLTVYYCCKACQVKDWKEGVESRHKVQCKSLIEMKARHTENAKKEIEDKLAGLGMHSGA